MSVDRISCLHASMRFSVWMLRNLLKKVVLDGIIFDGQKGQAGKTLERPEKKASWLTWVWVQVSWRAVMWTRHKFSSARDLTVLNLTMHTQWEDLNTGTRSPCGKPVERLLQYRVYIQLQICSGRESIRRVLREIKVSHNWVSHNCLGSPSAMQVSGGANTK